MGFKLTKTYEISNHHIICYSYVDGGLRIQIRNPPTAHKIMLIPLTVYLFMISVF